MGQATGTEQVPVMVAEPAVKPASGQVSGLAVRAASEQAPVCIVTGASGGIGRTIVKKFYDNGYSVVLLDLVKDKLDELASSLGLPIEEAAPQRCLVLEADISDEHSVENAIKATMECFGHIDALVNTAGIVGRYSLSEDYTFANFKRIYEVNVFGTFLAMQKVLPIMRAQGKGSIVNFGSVSGMRGYAYEIGYGSSKWAVIGMTENVASEYGQFGVRANSVSPGWVDTQMMKQTVDNYHELEGENNDTTVTLGPLGCAAKPEEIADAVYFLSNKEAAHITGANLVVDGGMLVA